MGICQNGTLTPQELNSSPDEILPVHHHYVQDTFERQDRIGYDHAQILVLLDA